MSKIEKYTFTVISSKTPHEMDCVGFKDASTESFETFEEAASAYNTLVANKEIQIVDFTMKVEYRDSLNTSSNDTICSGSDFVIAKFNKKSLESNFAGMNTQRWCVSKVKF